MTNVVCEETPLRAAKGLYRQPAGGLLMPRSPAVITCDTQYDPLKDVPVGLHLANPIQDGCP
eukprot:427326-Pyramimonas_sp.AAC.1